MKNVLHSHITYVRIEIHFQKCWLNFGGEKIDFKAEQFSRNTD